MVKSQNRIHMKIYFNTTQNSKKIYDTTLLKIVNIILINAQHQQLTVGSAEDAKATAGQRSRFVRRSLQQTTSAVDSKSRVFVAASIGAVEALKDQGVCRWNYHLRLLHNQAKKNLKSYYQTQILPPTGKFYSSTATAVVGKMKRSEKSMEKVMDLSCSSLFDCFLEMEKEETRSTKRVWQFGGIVFGRFTVLACWTPGPQDPGRLKN
ncbi:uncharacterized protein LOC111371444 [Olea europaea var. sylvestris]|uniref:uncharacterized protein LOC111371444 n=1 Tax=Olea europaea var. sylvestris TaxID=158386 RepID=UPI000C1CE69A|nr:uncharacterized protein LOC111371444 [Olea europaea var. sylvestris]